MLFLNAEQIMRALTFDQVMESVEKALHLYEARQFVMPDRLGVDCGGGNQLLLMPCVADGSIAAKLLTIYPGNRSRNRPMIDGLVMLADQSNGEILALMDAKTITAMRTGAVTGTSVRYLAKEDAHSVGLVGCGTQGYFQLRYACVARKIRRITLFDAAREVILPFVEKLRQALPEVTIEIASSTESLVRASDIVITATTARKPVFPDVPELFKGKHFVAIGSFQPDVREYPDAIFAVVERVWIDIDFAKEESGELLVPLREGRLKEEQLETLGHFILSGRAPERGAYGTTFFKTVGMALFDLTTAQLAYRNATSQGLGVKL
mgnify:CR=1 FL=1